jgi:hypothetical protein
VNRGWIKHGAIEVGDWVFSDKGMPVKVLAVSEKYTDSDCYEMRFRDGSSLVCGAGHLWKTKKKIRRRIIGTQKRHIEYQYNIRSTRDLIGLERIVLDATEPLVYEEVDYLVPPYVLGAWLGDGDKKSGRITKSDDELFDNIAACGFDISPRRGYSSTVYKLIPKLRAIGVFRNKHIPREYLEGSIEQRMELLRGLMDTDGHCDARGTATFCNTNERLARGAYELAMGLGLCPRFRGYCYDGYQHYQVCFQAHTDRNPFRLTRKACRAIAPSYYRGNRYVESLTKTDTVPTNCIQVEGGSYLAGRELIPTHNSTIITYGKTIQDILSSHGEEPLGVWGGREPTFGIFSCTRPIAKGFLRQIKQEFERNEMLKMLFPDVIWDRPSKDAPKWSEDDGLILKRKSNPKEATLEAWGIVDGQPTSKHFDVLVYDDIVTVDHVRSDGMIQKTLESWELSTNLGSHDVISRYIGTRYHFNDTYRVLMERDVVEPRLHPATKSGEPDGEPVLLPQQELIKKRKQMGIYTFACQMLLNPVADKSQGFKRDWVRFYENLGDLQGMNIYIVVDPANEKRKNSDFTAMEVIGLGPDKNYYTLDLVRDRLNLTERADELLRLHRKWRPPIVTGKPLFFLFSFAGSTTM